MIVQLNKLPASLQAPLRSFLSAMIGRDVQGVALKSGLPGDIIPLRIGGQMLRAMLQARGVQEGQNLHFRVEDREGQFILRLLDKAAGPELNGPLKAFLARLGPERLQFFHSLTELIQAWKEESRAHSERSQRSGRSQGTGPNEGPGAPGQDSSLPADAVHGQAGQQEREESSKEESQGGFGSLQRSPYFFGIVPTVPDIGPTLFVFYSDQPEFQFFRLLLVQPDASARKDLERIFAGVEVPGLQEVQILDRFPDMSFFQTGQLWEA